MASPAQIAANRANALLSTGPATPEGKSAVRLNAIKYGIHAESLIIPGEDPEEFEQFKEFQIDAWHPQTTAEQQCVDQLTTDSWRLNRLLNAESKMWDSGIDSLEQKAPVFDRVSRMIDRLQRSIRQITRELQRLQALHAKNKAKSAAPHPPTNQSQYLTQLLRLQADSDQLDE
jgi:hypothetical protein